MSKRVQIILEEEEREVFRQMAESQGLSLSAWLREAGRARLADVRSRRISTLDELRRFFEAVDEREEGVEPDWAEHRDVIETSKSSGGTGT